MKDKADLVNDCILLDQENMSDEFRDGQGNPIAWDSLPRLMSQAIDNGAILKTVYRNDSLDSYLFYTIKDKKSFVISIQLKDPRHNFKGLKNLLRLIENEMISSDVEIVNSVVDKTNCKSISFHKSLGFRVTSERETAYCFEIKMHELRENLQRYL